MDDEYTVLDAVRDILESDQSFFQTVRFLDGRTRNHLVAAHLRNTHTILTLVRMYMNQPATTTMVMNIPLNLDVSGNFFDAVPIRPTQAQITAAVETNVETPDGTCAICQDNVSRATRIRHCGHCFHASCINQWFEMNPRCPVCRHDVRDLQTRTSNSSNGSRHRVYSDEE